MASYCQRSFTDCSCVPSQEFTTLSPPSDDLFPEITSGMCSDKCPQFYLFIVGLFLMLLFEFVTVQGGLASLLRQASNYQVIKHLVIRRQVSDHKLMVMTCQLANVLKFTCYWLTHINNYSNKFTCDNSTRVAQEMFAPLKNNYLYIVLC